MSNQKPKNQTIEFAGWRCRTGSRRDGLPTLKQAQTIACLAAGMSHKEIASLRGVSPNTIKSTIMNVNFWLNTTRSTAAVAEAMRRGWISPLCVLLIITSMTAGMNTSAVRVRQPRPRTEYTRTVNAREVA